MKINSLKNADLTGKKVFVRADFNVPIENGVIQDDTRISATLPTINYLLEKNAKIILASHLGRPDGKKNEQDSLAPIAEYLEKKLLKTVTFLPDCIGDEIVKTISSAEEGTIFLLENTRFHTEEESNDPEFAKKLANLADIFVIDSFGTAHRKHASTYGIAEYLPAYAGLLMTREIDELSRIMTEPEHPFVLVLGGAKTETKIPLIKNLLKDADYILLGGGLANTFNAAKGYDMAKSLYEEDKIELAREIMLQAEMVNTQILTSEDAIVADDATDSAESIDLPINDIEGEMQALDIGIKTVHKYYNLIKDAKTIIWNGPMGLFEIEKFASGTRQIAKAIAANKSARTIIGGGDTIDAIKDAKLGFDEFTHVSTGGGAMLDFLGGNDLPGIDIIKA
ncbi:phosphoglycerate kinase [Candidatus Peregrinibacteria bacterium]|nr:phosphoglycerate kinase [Candidatus Peregrinibacteria bacterium]